MTDNELLLAISDILDKRLCAHTEQFDIKLHSQSEQFDRKLWEQDARFDAKFKEQDARFARIEKRLDAIGDDIRQLKADVKRINLILENEIRRDLNLLIENILPAAKRYETAATEIDTLKSDMDVVKRVVREHSEQLQMISIE